MNDRNFEIIAAAQDTGGDAAAGPFYDAAKATFTTLIDAAHTVSSLFQFINVPMGAWIDEQGRVVRPPEPAWTSTKTNEYGGKPVATQGEQYVAALRDWVTKGDDSAYVLSDAAFAARVKPRELDEMEADASFKLAVWFQQTGHATLAAKHFARAQALCPRNWNYHRQQWSFAPDASKRWLEKFLATEGDYYPRLRLDTSE